MRSGTSVFFLLRSGLQGFRSAALVVKRSVTRSGSYPSWMGRCCTVAAFNLCLTVAASAATYTVPSFNGSSIQATINSAYSAGSNNLVLLPAGSYTVSSPITLPCNNGLTISGPMTTPASAVLNATFSNSSILNLSGCTGVTIEYLKFVNSGGIYAGGTNHSGITVTHNQFFGLPSSIGGGSNASAAVYLDGSLNTTITDFTATWNTFGDSTSCTAVFATVADEGGYCAGIYAQPGILVNPLVQYNIFNHVEEGMHYHQICSGCPKGSNQSVTQNSIVQFNYFVNWHRIAIEVQGGVIGSAQIISDNELERPLNASWGTMFISDACCTNGRAYLASPPANPANLTEDNLMWTDIPQPSSGFLGPVIGIEFWGGSGSRANNNFAMGNFANQLDWGYGAQPWYMENNYLCAAHSGSYISNEENSSTPTFANNTTAAACTQQSSAAATIVPAGGTYTTSPTVTLTTSGRNTSIYYTTDGSKPVPGSGTAQLYTGPFTPTLPATVQAVGMWGVPPQPTSFPAPYGFAPSAVATASYTATPGSRTVAVLTGVTIAGAGGQQSLIQGATLQMAAACNYSDGTTTNCTTADSHGNAVNPWSSSNGAVTVSASGLATAVSAGSTSIVAVVAGIAAPAWSLTVTPPVITLTSVTLSNQGSVHALTKGMALQMTATCGYSDGSTTDCTTADSHSNAVSAWTSSSSAVLTVSPTGMATATAAGFTNITAMVAGLTTTAWPFTVVTPALSQVALNTTGAAASLTTGAVNQLVATCQYSDGSTTNCTTTDTNGSVANPWTSSMPTVASVSSTGVVTAVAAGSTNLSATVTPTTTTQWGATTFDQSGFTYPGWINATYLTLGTQPGGYTSGTCSFYLPPATLTVGSQYDCGLVPAPTTTTQGANWQCWYTYTVTNATWPGGWISGAMSDCGPLSAGSSWWVSLVTNQPGPSPAGFYDCGNTCAGTAPTTGSGTYPYGFIADAYGTRTGMTTAMIAGPARQAAQYVTLGQPSMASNPVALMVTPATPTLSSVYLTTANNATTILKGGTLQFTAWGVYSDGSVQKLPDTQGDTVGLWNTSSHAIAKVSTLGHVTAISAGTVNIMAYVGSVAATPKTITITAPPAPSKAPGNTAANADDAGAAGSLTENPSPRGPASPLADPFAGPLWNLTAPVGGSASISQSHLFLGVPGGSNHDAMSGQDNAVRVLQPMGDESFDVAIEIDSSLSAADVGTSQGLVVEGDDRNYISYSLDTDGTKVGMSLLTVSNGVVATVLQDSDLTHYQSPMHLRLTRSGSGYIAFYSTDGQNWQQAASFNFATTPTAIGPFAANHADAPSDAVPVVMSVSSFEAR